jgi:hypothetical protein
LIEFEGTGETAPDRARDCAVCESTLVTGKTAVHLAGTGARLRLQNSVVVAEGDAFHLDPGPAAKPRLNGLCFLEHTTVAAGRAVFRLGDAPALSAPAEPFLVQAKANVFLNPFVGPAYPAGVLAYEGEALARGLLVWQGEDNVYDKGLHFYAASVEKTAELRQPYRTWTQVWGTSGDRRPVLLDPQYSALFDPDSPRLGLLALPRSFRAANDAAPPGADLAGLGILGGSRKRPK